jgi:hypothetical protein
MSISVIDARAGDPGYRKAARRLMIRCTLIGKSAHPPTGALLTQLYGQ